MIKTLDDYLKEIENLKIDFTEFDKYIKESKNKFTVQLLVRVANKKFNQWETEQWKKEHELEQ